MIFSQVEYLAFFAAVFFSYWAAPRRARIWVLLFASLGFYGTWNWRYLALILGSSAVDHVAAHRIAASEDTRVRNRWLLGSLVANLGSLAVFKYADFFLQSAAGLVEALGFHASIPTLNLLLPVGISFYTFQSMSYTIDVWRRQRAPEPSAVHFVTYVAFFPQLVAGPIVRVGELMDQLHALPPLTVEKARRGGRLFLWGLVKKAVYQIVVRPPVTPNSAMKMRFLLPG